MGKQYELTGSAPDLQGPPDGYHSVFGRASAGGALNYDEWAIYNTDAILPWCLVEYTYTRAGAVVVDPIVTPGDAQCIMCEQHREVCKVFCVTCRELICVYCREFGPHKEKDGHDSVLAVDAAASERADVQVEIGKLQAYETQLRSGQDGVEAMMDRVAQQSSEVQKNIDAHATAVIDWVGAQLDALKAQALAREANTVGWSFMRRHHSFTVKRGVIDAQVINSPSPPTNMQIQ